MVAYLTRRTCICEVFSGKPLGGRDARGSQGNCAPLSLGHTALLTTKKKSLPGRPGRPLHSFDGAQSHMVIAHRARSGEIQRGHVVCCHRVGPVIKPALPNYRVPAGSGRGPLCRARVCLAGGSPVASPGVAHVGSCHCGPGPQRYEKPRLRSAERTAPASVPMLAAMVAYSLLNFPLSWHDV
jgi:hypothetical protein